MLFRKFSILLLFSLSVFSFSGNDCFISNFDVAVTHKSFPFGLLTKNISIKKKKCNLKVSFNRYKYLNSSWEVDICRDPVHIKETTRTTDVIRKINECTNVKNSFCKEYLTIKKIIEDNGLIFAKGNKSNLDSAHGKVYCSYLLLNRYLDKNLVFNSGRDYDFISKQISTDGHESDFSIDENSGTADF